MYVLLGVVTIIICSTDVEAKKECDIAAIEPWIKGDNAFAALAQIEFFTKMNIGVVIASNLTELEQEVQKKYATDGCDCIRNLYILGHGNKGNITVGDGMYGNNQNKHINGNEAKWSTPLKNLGILLCDTSSTVWLIGCNVGACNKGSSKLYKIAQTVNAIVKAPVDKPYGGEVFDYINNGRFQTATPSSVPSHMTAKTDDKSKKKTKKAATKYYCPCNNLPFDSVSVCTNNCPTSLSCYIGICNAYYTNTTWDKYVSNPVMTAGTTGTWDSHGVSQPLVLKASPYAMWYAGWNVSDVESIGYATSNDGINWTKYASNPILIPGTSGKWDDYGVYGPSVIKDGSTYKMWYAGFSYANSLAQIGYATSTDGITWTKYSGNPVLTKGSSVDFDANGATHPSVIKDGSTYKMWYGGKSKSGWWQIGYATSPDSITWTKYSGNPVVTYGSSGSWNYWGVDAPSVVKDVSTYHMLFIGLKSKNEGAIGYATSTDGINWTEDPSNPHFSSSYRHDFESVNVGHPVLYKDSNESVFKAYYRGKNSTPTWAIGYGVASSLDINTSTTTTTAVSSTTTTITSSTSTTTSVSNNLCPFQLLYGEDAEEIEVLRVFRDEVLSASPEGQELIDIYYQWGPVVVEAMEEDEEFNELVKEVSDAILLEFTRTLESSSHF